MEVKLVSVTPDPEQFIAFIARVSNPQNQKNPEYAKLIAYLLSHGHYSPFEHSFMTVEIKTSMAIGEQLLRHRSFTFQKYSGRYNTFAGFEDVELRAQAHKNRQSSTDVIDPVAMTFKDDNVKETEYYYASDLVKSALEYADWTYNKLLELGIARESARFVLPAATSTTMYMTGSARSWIHYLQLRTEDDTQKEHRLVAQEIDKIFAVQFPITHSAMEVMRREQARKDFVYKEWAETNGD